MPGSRPLLRLFQGTLISRGRVQSFMFVFVFSVKSSPAAPAAAVLGGGGGASRGSLCRSPPRPRPRPGPRPGPRRRVGPPAGGVFAHLRKSQRPASRSLRRFRQEGDSGHVFQTASYGWEALASRGKFF